MLATDNRYADLHFGAPLGMSASRVGIQAESAHHLLVYWLGIDSKFKNQASKIIWLVGEAMGVSAWLVLVSMLLVCGEDLYTLLGVSRSATSSEIKAAYRVKARETHPDKNLNDPEGAAKEFRKIVSAFEVLSDDSSKRHYDATGSSDSRQNSDAHSRSGSSAHQWFDNFARQYFYQAQDRQQYHRFLHDPYLRSQIRSCQSRVIRFHSIQQLESIVLDDKQVIDRYVLLAFVTPTASCRHELDNILLYPFPFAGYSAWESQQSVYWDEILIVGLVDVNDPDSAGILDLFDIPKDTRCGSVLLLPRGVSIVSQKHKKPIHFDTNEAFKEYVWPALKIKVRFVNRSPWPLDFWWIDGARGVKQPVLEVGGSYETDTFLSHTFVFRPSFVEGNALTNESSLLWFTATVKDDNSVVEVLPRCFDKSGECKRWAGEGFCGGSPSSPYVRQNPSFERWVQQNCLVSCKKSCPAAGVSAESQPAHLLMYHHEEL